MSSREEREALRAAEAERPHWIRPDGSVDLTAWREEKAARAAGGWGVWHMECAGCSRRWVAVAPLSMRFPAECPGCGNMSGEAYTPGPPCAPCSARCDDGHQEPP